MSKIAKIPLILLGIALGFFVVTFTVYIFNLDMKATSLIAPLLEKWYDHLEHKPYLYTYKRDAGGKASGVFCV